MKNLTLLSLLCCLILLTETHKSFAQWTGGTPFNNSTLVTGGSVGIGNALPMAKLDINGKGDNIINSTNKIIDADLLDMISVHSLNKTSVVNLVSSRADAGALGGLIFTTTNGWADSHRNIAGIVGGRVSTSFTAGGYLGFWTKNDNGDIPRENMRINWDGNVGIGTVAPVFKLDVEGAGARIKNSSSALNAYTTYRLQGPNYANGLEIDFFGNNNYTSDSYGGGVGSAAIVNVNAKPLVFGTNNMGRMLIDGNGNVGIGTAAPGSFKLAVEGKIGAREVNVTTTNPWPDYVFEKNYALPTLTELEAFIKVNKHLPEVPAACTMEENGVNLGEMNMLLLKKVEELTLYMIEMKKENEKQNAIQQAEIELLKSKINK